MGPSRISEYIRFKEHLGPGSLMLGWAEHREVRVGLTKNACSCHEGVCNILHCHQLQMNSALVLEDGGNHLPVLGAFKQFHIEV